MIFSVAKASFLSRRYDDAKKYGVPLAIFCVNYQWSQEIALENGKGLRQFQLLKSILIPVIH